MPHVAPMLARGPRVSLEVSRLRAKIWYLHVRSVAQRTEHALTQLLECRIVLGGDGRPFRVLRKKWMDPGRTTRDRDWTLVDVLAEGDTAYAASRNIYNLPLWAFLMRKFPSLSSLHGDVNRELAHRGYVRPTPDQRELFELALPGSTLFRWTADHALNLHFHRWETAVGADDGRRKFETTMHDLSFAASLFVEAALAGAWDVVDRWKDSLLRHAQIVGQSPWMQPTADTGELNLMETVRRRLIDDPPKPSIDPSDSISATLRSPTLGIRDDVAWFLQTKDQLAAAVDDMVTNPDGIEDLVARRLSAAREDAVGFGVGRGFPWVNEGVAGVGRMPDSRKRFSTSRGGGGGGDHEIT